MTPPAPEPARTGQELLERYAALALDRPSSLYEVIGDNAWNTDMTAGTITFGPQLVFPMQVLGTFSHSSRTWRWAWANAQSNLPDPVLAQARQLRAYGEPYGLDLLTTDQFEATENDLHRLGLIASGLGNASGYYLADYGAGILLLTVKSELLDQVPKNDFARIPTIFSQVISLFELRHRPAFRQYLAQKGYSVTETADTVSADVDAGTLTATFDELGRLTNLQGTSHPRS